MMQAFRDPDHYFCEWWSRGVWLGSPERKLPRTPAIYDRKTKWPVYDTSTCLHGQWKVNYGSLKEHEKQVIHQLREEVKENLMVEMSLKEALDLYGGDLLVAATGAIAKKGHGPGGEVRVIFDGTNGVFLNVGIRTRDQVRFPTAPDVKAVLSELAEDGGSYLMLLYDIKKAHRRIPVRVRDWGRQACQIRGSAALSAQNRRSDRKRSTGETPKDRKAEFQKLSKSDFTKSELKEKVFLNCVGRVLVGQGRRGHRSPDPLHPWLRARALGFALLRRRHGGLREARQGDRSPSPHVCARPPERALVVEEGARGDRGGVDRLLARRRSV